MANSKKNPFVKPYLKWAGGKRQLLPQIREQLGRLLTTNTYYEPFVGAGAVFFEYQPCKAVINDTNAQLILTYKMVRDHADELIAALKTHVVSNSEDYFYEIREMDRDTAAFDKLTDVEKAARLIYLNKTCFNGLYRVNAQGLFNAPYGRYKNPAICDEPVLLAIHNYLLGAGEALVILSGDFDDAVRTADHNSVVYFDPPYHSADNTNFTGYQAGRFGEQEQTRLRNTFAELTERGAKCLLSNSDTAFIRELYASDRYTITAVSAKRAINSDAAGRGEVNELLIRNRR
ncbi:modification methylase [Synergistales bacterium]|nr:modification methylase [Synergistales bacterium]